MKPNQEIDFEGMIFSYIDEFKFLIFPDKWNSIFLDYSKNEIMALLFLYRFKTANMTQISKYINAPLNTTTGVVNRLEKKKIIERIRSKEDRRIVEIVLTQKGSEFINEEKKNILSIVKAIYEKLTEDEKSAAINIFRKVTEVLMKDMASKDAKSSTKKIKKINIE
ncbi:MarR family winged helix-turn-helix transcriptional regulator [Clostridium hydrogenum]|uniref:MarR family winged helix-turn-helix transcriptional regulator n=1 Tax=Clostridium hydrogenum TaxID=2855764 RepID=UPI001F1F4A7B|nr:MarR family transcriptional regulator [Clostridium hydrogenum]